ncbi:MAG: extensin family protein [Alphaproteobacteria bacterium]|nr:extensin family protein [Alphaproteobacteria bacterium]
MRMLTIGLLLVAVTATTPAQAQNWLDQVGNAVESLTAPLQPPKNQGPTPPTRPTEPTVNVPVVAPVAPPIPRPRPETLDGAAPAETAPPAEAAPEIAPAPEAGEQAVPATVAPDAEAEAPVDMRVYQGACPAVINGLVAATMVPPLSEEGCGERSPLLVTAILSRGRMVSLANPVTTNCAMASALPGWLASVDGYASSVLGSPLAEIVTGTDYMCRARVGGEAALMSEHGFANALDISGFVLEDGRRLDVKQDWPQADAPEGRLWRLAHDAACSSFTTVLGPEANAEHDDHLHLDLGCHGKSCTAQLCQ